ncbi:hypothetical protein J3Q64DRAFT_1875147 [Phycomyces blakesleeanus]|uniref:SCD domain-containing protein n=2 Tax=Phycomyces blakesleeanus TaxID=4837 RepID=A0A167R2A4_PHYB8|nr:hypothetical protein PHYBLDRAFT_76807 [Phycomyces blakesleeanus NRRL 1555(-)]OAD80679.1 hypothetical protein PHYBLDRAFT_76807 [Phycomyces blakesleeanus NRRL 1555(-)]|eukprot:XP_018298719.1 hypothetical protein PHYBLDRAFT_76807 [Phycomyces blakesleeanus NRRL 1555(-)]
MARSKSNTSKQKASINDSTRRSDRPKTVPELFMSQKQFAIAASRGEQDDSDNENESDSNTSSDDSDNETSSDDEPSTHKQQKKGSKKVGSKASQKKGKLTKVRLSNSSQLLEQVAEEDNNTSLYDMVTSKTADIDGLVAVWVNEYASHKVESLRELINFIIRSCGCMMAVTAHAFKGEDIAVNAMKELQEELVKLPHHEYPIISKSKDSKLLKNNLLEFFQSLVEQCQHEIIFDGTLIETLQSWLTTMSSSVYRPFRHTATLIAFKITSALATISEKLKDELSIVTRQLRTESAKPTNRARPSAKIKQLQQRSEKLETRRKDLEEYLNDFFESVFVHRSRDVESIIRNEAIKELCVWMQLYPSYFIDNRHLRHFGWAFNDQNTLVRSEALKSVTRLCKIEGNAANLHEFIGRFKARVEEIALYDIDVSVRVHAIGLCSELHTRKYEMLGTNEQRKLSDLIVSDIPRVRKSVAPFVKTLIEKELVKPKLIEVNDSLSGMVVDAPQHDNDSRRGRPNRSTATVAASANTAWVTFKCIASFLVERTESARSSLQNNGQDSIDIDETVSRDTQHIVSNTIEALWGQMKDLHDFKAMSDYLSRDHSRVQQNSRRNSLSTATEIDECYRLTEDEETILITAFVSCLKIGIQRGFEKSSGKEKKKDDQQIEEIRNDVSRHLVQFLPSLLIKHSDNASRMIQLVSIPQLMNLSVYLELRMSKEYEDLLESLMKVFLRATLPKLLRNCAESLKHIADATYLEDVNRSQLIELQERVVGQVRDSCRGKDLATARFTVDDVHSISVSMLRLDYLSNFIDTTDAMDETEDISTDVTTLVGGVVERSVYGYEKEKQMHLSAMSVLFRYAAWKCNTIVSDPEMTSVGQQAAAKLNKRRDWIVDKFVDIVTITDVNPLTEIRHASFGILVDLYWLFSSDMFASHSSSAFLAHLYLPCPEQLQSQCVEYITKDIEARRKLLEDTASDSESVTTSNESKQDFVKLMTSFARGLMLDIFDVEHATVLLSQYGHLESEVDDVIKALVEELNKGLVLNQGIASNICKAYLESLKESFELDVDQSQRSMDNTVKLARLLSHSIKRVDQQNVVRRVSQVICTHIHLDGIRYALSKAAEYKEKGNDAAKALFLKFFKVLSVFGKQLTRAHDVAKIHQNLEDELVNRGLTVETGDKAWDAYHGYIKTIDDILKKSGLRYDPSKRAEMATPRADMATPRVPDDVMQEVEDDIENFGRDSTKRGIESVEEMEIETTNISKRRR